MLNIFQKSGDEVVLVSRNENNERTLETIQHTPYFYVPDEKGNYESIYGDSLRKVEVDSSFQVRKERKKYDKTFESDVLFTNRVLIDKVDDFGNPPIRIMYFDIENTGSLDVKGAPEPITCICCFDNFSETMYGFIWHPDKEERKEVDDMKLETEDGTKIVEKKTYWFNSEEDMLKKFIRFITDFDFDLLCGWNSNGFDMPYIVNRCRKLDVRIDLISMKGKISLYEWNPFWKVRIKGRYSFDLLQGYKNLMFKQMDSFKLDDVAKKELDDAKIDVTHYNWKELWEDNPELLVNYCYQDAMLVYRIDEKKGIIKYNDVKRKLIGCQWEDLWSVNRFHDIVFLREAKKRDIVLPSHEKKERSSFKGAIVQTPEPGIKENVVCVDLKSLYPFIIKTFNLSPETLDPSGSVKANNLRFTQEKEGIVPYIVSHYLKKRFKYKDRMYECKKGTNEYDVYYKRQYGTKVIANSVFGALGYPNFRLYKPEIADTILYLGREIIKWTKKKSEEWGYPVVYGDTDSVFIKMPNNFTLEECREHGKELASKLTESYQEFVEQFGVEKNQLVMEYEKLFSEIFFGCDNSGNAIKKRYAGNLIYEDKKGEKVKEFKVMGFEIRRSDTAKLEQDVLREVFIKLLDGVGKEDIEEYIQNVKEKIMNGKYSWGDIAIRRTIKKIDRSRRDMYIEAFDYGNKYLGCKFKKGDRIKMLFIDNMPDGYPNNRTIAFEYENQVPEGVEINWDKTFERMFDSKLKRIYLAMGWGNYNSRRIGQVTLFD